MRPRCHVSGKVWTYMLGVACPQVAARQSIVVEADPLGKLVLGKGGVLVAPVQHAVVEVEANPLAIRAQDALGVVEEVIGVDDGQVGAVDESLLQEEVEEAAHLIVACLSRIEVVETRHLVQRRHSTAEVGGDGAARMTDEEGELELAEDINGDDGRVVRLSELLAAQRGCDGSGGTRGGEEVVNDILNEDTLGAL